MDFNFNDISSRLTPALEKAARPYAVGFDGLIILNEEQVMLEISKGVEKLFGYPEGGLAKQSIEEILQIGEREGHSGWVSGAAKRIKAQAGDDWETFVAAKTMSERGAHDSRGALRGKKRNGDLVELNVTLLFGFTPDREFRALGFIKVLRVIDGAGQLRIFCSYKRHQVDPADRSRIIRYEGTDLAAELAAELSRLPDVDVWYDRGNIIEGPEWEPQIFEGLDRSGVFVLILTPGYADSEYCMKEVSGAIERKANILMVLPDGENFPANWDKIPSEAKRKQGIKEWPSVASLATKIVGECELEKEHAEEYVRLQRRAEDWKNSNRNHKNLLTGLLLANAKAWRDKEKIPWPNELQSEFIKTSISYARRRWLVRSVFGGATFITCSVAGFFGYRTVHIPFEVKVRADNVNSSVRPRRPTEDEYTDQQIKEMQKAFRRMKRRSESYLPVQDISFFEYRPGWIIGAASTRHIAEESRGDYDMHSDNSRETNTDIKAIHDEGECASTIYKNENILLISCPVLIDGKVIGFSVVSFQGPEGFRGAGINSYDNTDREKKIAKLAATTVQYINFEKQTQ